MSVDSTSWACGFTSGLRHHLTSFEVVTISNRIVQMMIGKSVRTWDMVRPHSEDNYDVWARDASVLQEIGRLLSQERYPVTVRLPMDLADQALVAWQREDTGELPNPESLEQNEMRNQAATLALIGSCVENASSVEGNWVIVQLDAWFVGDALSAADRARSVDS